MATPILQFKRGQFTQLPGLRAGEPGFTTDRYDLFVGLTSSLADNKFFGSHRYWDREDGTTSLKFSLVDKDGDNSIDLKSPDSLSGVTTYTFPETPIDASLLTTDADGQLSWVAVIPSLSVTHLGVAGVSTFAAQVLITDTTQSDTKDSGALVIDGGIGVEKNANVGGILRVTGISTFESHVTIGGATTATSFHGEGGDLTLGSASDGSLVTPGALNTFTTTTKIVDGIDDLNELAYNILGNTAVSNVDFSSNPTVGGSPLNVNLTVTSDGNANRYDISWGDGTTTLNSSSSSISHTYTQPTGGLFSITATAKNASGVGAGSSQTVSKDDYITVYTPDPSVTFSLFRAPTGGSALSGNDFYVVEGQPLYLDNNTTNTTGATVDYTVNWGDGSSNDAVSDDNASGGVSGTRLLHTWGQGTSSSTSTDTLTITLNNHNTANPNVIPANGSVSLKVYDDTPVAPDGLSAKTLSNVSSTGVSPRLASGFTDSTGGSVLSAGDSVNRVTSGTATAGPITTFAYDGDSGTLTAQLNGTSDGSRALTNGDDTGSYTSLTIDSESDYQLLNSSGSSTSFANSIYYPGLYKGFKARVSKSVSSLNIGLNSMQLIHSSTGNTNKVEFVKDDLTSTPTVDVSSIALTENVSGTYRYISGIPYYNTGSPSLSLAGVTISNLVGQTYTSQSNIVEVDHGTNQEGTSSSAITSSDYSYSNIDGASTMLSGGIPVVNVGTSSPYSIGTLTIPITSSDVRTVDRLKVRARNVNGASGYSSDIATNIQVHKASQSGISEIAIDVANSLGNGTYTDDGARIFDFSADTTNNPSYTSSTNFYTNNVYNESTDPGVAGTKEASVRLGNIKYDATDYSVGYLPVGPDRSGDTGTQYFTFAFRRQVVANFNINITSSGIAGLWIAAPGTSIDNTSTLNGWINSGAAYAGSGIPGGNTGNGGNGSDGCAATSGDIISAGSALSGSYTMTLGSENLSNANGNVCLIRIALTSGQSITSLNIT
nr:hypothetical protein [uncultured Mediterranean phage uvMED]|tara:strand:- start:20116 stop:23109 length:2994 start_codon:yes stop_codon:yes gene_type:complete